MNAIRTFAEVKDHEVHIKLPAGFPSGKVEIIIIPFILPKEKDKKENGLTKLQSLLLEAPDMSDEEFNAILEKRKSLNQWN